MTAKATASPARADWRMLQVHTSRARSLTSKWISGLLLCVLLASSLIALHQVAKTPRPFSNESESTQSIQTIRDFYAGLNEYMDTGDVDAVLETMSPDALAYAPAHGGMGDGSGLLTYLLALRSTSPQMRFAVDGIEGSGNIAVASIVTTGSSEANAISWHGERSHEFFRIHDGRIVQHWTSAPSSVLLHSLLAQPLSVEIIQPAHLAIAELSIAPGADNPQAVDGPALLIIQSGRLTLTGNGSSQVMEIANGATSVPAPNELASAAPGQSILIPQYKAFVSNRDADTAEVLIATLVDDPRQAQEAVPGDRRPPPPSLNDYARLSSIRPVTNEHVTVRPHQFDVRSIPTGTWRLEVTWVVLGPGTSHSPSLDGEWAVAHVLSGSATFDTECQRVRQAPHTLTNHGDVPALVLVVRLDPAP